MKHILNYIPVYPERSKAEIEISHGARTDMVILRGNDVIMDQFRNLQSGPRDSENIRFNSSDDNAVIHRIAQFPLGKP